MMFSQIEQRGSCKNNDSPRQQLGYRKSDPRKDKLVCPQALYPDSSQRISENI